MGDGGISPKNAGMGVIGGWGYFKRDGGISNQEDTMYCCLPIKHAGLCSVP